MSLWSILSLLVRLVGLIPLAESIWQRHDAKAKRQAIADSPATRDELEKTLDKGEL